MARNSGWVTLHRQLMDEESTFNRLTIVQKMIAIYLILQANHKDGVWYDRYRDIEVEVKRGQLITSRASIKSWFPNDKEVTEQKIRTSLDKLEKFGFLTKQSTKLYTLITICHYNDYQAIKKESNQEDNQETTKSQPSDNQVVNHKQQSFNNVLTMSNNENNNNSNTAAKASGECQEFFNLHELGNDYLSYYAAQYYKTFLKNHPRIPLNRIEELLQGISQNEFGSTNIKELTDYHFENLPQKNDGKIYSFLHENYRNRIIEEMNLDKEYDF